jgi:hypothetical protein
VWQFPKKNASRCLRRTASRCRSRPARLFSFARSASSRPMLPLVAVKKERKNNNLSELNIYLLGTSNLLIFMSIQNYYCFNKVFTFTWKLCLFLFFPNWTSISLSFYWSSDTNSSAQEDFIPFVSFCFTNKKLYDGT